MNEEEEKKGDILALISPQDDGFNDTLMEYHAYRAVDDVRETYTDLVIVLENCHNVLNLKPDISQSP